MYAAKMTGLCFRYVGDVDTAKDIAQDGFLKVFSGIKQFKGKGSFEGWMKRIFINTAISHLRKKSKEGNQIRFDEINEFDASMFETHVSDIQDDVNALQKENIDLVLLADLSEDELLKALNEIPEKFRTVFNLFCIEHIKHDEIAHILKIDKATSRTRLLRARGLIQKELFAISRKKLKKSSYE